MFLWYNPKEDLTGHFKRFKEMSRIKAKQRLSVYVLCNYNSTLDEDLCHRANLEFYLLSTLHYGISSQAALSTPAACQSPMFTLYRIETLKELGYAPYVMIYNKPEAPPVTRQLQRWVNNRRIFNVVDSFKDYRTNY